MGSRPCAVKQQVRQLGSSDPIGQGSIVVDQTAYGCEVWIAWNINCESDVGGEYTTVLVCMHPDGHREKPEIGETAYCFNSPRAGPSPVTIHDRIPEFQLFVLPMALNFSQTTFNTLMRLPAAERKNAALRATTRLGRGSTFPASAGRTETRYSGQVGLGHGFVEPVKPARGAEKAFAREETWVSPGFYPYEEAPGGVATGQPAEYAADDHTVDFIAMLQRPDLTKAEAQSCARFLVSVTDDSDIHRFKQSPTGLVEAVLYYHTFSENLSVVQRAASLARCQTLSGTHGEWTRGDDYLTPPQLAFVEEYGIGDIVPTFPSGYLGHADIDQTLPAGNATIIRCQFVDPEPWPSQRGVGHAIYRNSSVVDDFQINDDTSWFTVLSGSVYWTVWCPQAGIGVYPLYNVTQCTPFSSTPSGTSRHFTTDWYGLRCLMTFLQPIIASTRVAFLNGDHGEATNSDDVKARRTKAKKQRPQRRRSAPRRVVQRRPAVGMSSCALKYAKAIADPFAPSAAGACIPTFPSPDSMKSHTLTRAVTVVIGTAGIGGVFMSTSCASDAPIAAVTTAQYSAATLVMPSVEVVGDFAFAMPNAPFSMADITGAGVRCRCVSYGLKISYSGTQLDMGGTLAGFFDPVHTVMGGLSHSVQSVSNLPYGSFENVDRRMNFRLQTASVNAHETTFETNFNPYCPNTKATNYERVRFGAIGAIVISGKPGTTFNLEIVQHIEYIGRPAAAALTPTHTDSRGFEMVQQAAGQLATATANNRRSSWDVMRELLGHAAAELAPIAANGVSLVARNVVRSQRRALGFH